MLTTLNFQKKYKMTKPIERYKIIQKIYNEELLPDTIIGQTQKWWLIKYHPDNDIPKNIYLLEQGTVENLFDKYISKYGIIEWNEFVNYTRELIKQTIMF